MISPAAILVSPAPVDGYPPVQHQARMLANAGYRVELLTTALPWTAPTIGFAQPGVTVHAVPELPGGALGAAGRVWRFVSKLTNLRRKSARGGPIIEIAYEPAGVLYSDLAPGRPPVRIAHFHETLQNFERQWIERRLRSAIRGFGLAVVADADRGLILQEQLSIPASSVAVVPNYPPLERSRPQPRSPDAPFSVVYCGTLGLHQKLDLIIRSVRHWPATSEFRIIGQAGTATGDLLRTLARDEGVGDRVIFEGWVAYDQVPRRLAEADLSISLLDPSFEQWRTALGASNKRYQYMQAGLAQIGDMNPGVAELLEGQSIGRCVRSHEVDEISALVNAYAADPEARRRDGERAKALHESLYNYQAAFQPVVDWLAARLNRPIGFRDAGSIQP